MMASLGHLGGLGSKVVVGGAAGVVPRPCSAPRGSQQRQPRMQHLHAGSQVCKVPAHIAPALCAGSAYMLPCCTVLNSGAWVTAAGICMADISISRCSSTCMSTPVTCRNACIRWQSQIRRSAACNPRQRHVTSWS